MKKTENNIPEKMPYTTAEKLAEILCGVLMTAALAFYIRLVYTSGSVSDIIVFMMIATIVYISLTGLSVHPELISKPEKLHRNRRIVLAVKTVIIALCLAALVMMTFPIYADVAYYL